MTLDFTSIEDNDVVIFDNEYYSENINQNKNLFSQEKKDSIDNHMYYFDDTHIIKFVSRSINKSTYTDKIYSDISDDETTFYSIIDNISDFESNYDSCNE